MLGIPSGFLLKIGGILTSIITVILSVFAIRRSGVKQGRQEVINETNETIVQQVETAKKIEEEVARVPDDELRVRSSRWVRKAPRTD